MEEDIKIIKASKIMSDDIPHSEHSKRLRKALENLIKGYKLLEHRLEVANDFIESRKKNMIPEHYDDLKYIINECDLNSSW